MYRKTHYYLFYSLIVLGLISLIAVLETIGSGVKMKLIQEGGPIEQLSAVGYFICLMTLLFFRIGDAKTHLSVMFLVLMLGLRELDFHVLFTPMSMEKIKFYWSPDVSIHSKVVGASIILSLLLCCAYLMKKHLWGIIKSLKRLEPDAVGLFLGLAFIGIAKTLDGMQRKLGDFHITITRNMMELTTVAEEILELGIPYMFIIAVLAHHYKSSQKMQ
ncbi:hypothetical protein [Desulforhabdus sp. TSK]|uniref:hypothetical protein n=1 Tax=Desulforhabdus sp. TSK TaxID=2925014 RepID=UPI001FC8DCE7|nr:hypothetical protein [Desulforhabdus sp. TSK]GKT08181.1 hypothetical protein DSTSK_14860 [Desulforhabdus sp. TSK]